MKKLIALFCLLSFMGSCEKDESQKRELIISAKGILTGGTYVSLDESDGIFSNGYSVYLHKGEIEVTDEILKNPVANCCNSSRGIFFKTIEDGLYTIIVDVYYLHSGAFGSSSFSGMAYTTIKYPNPDVGITFTFDWSRNISTYNQSGITYVNLRKL